jgi:hypothetical protein
MASLLSGFCQKYRFPYTERKSLDHFLQKLHEKKQTDVQQQQASHAIMIYYELVKYRDASSEKPAKASVQPPMPEKTTTGMSWMEEYTRLSNEIQVRHYSPKTLKTYKLWVRHFQTYTKSLEPKSLSTDHVKAFLTFLAVTKKVSASTQNQAFNALLFFYRHVLKQEFGKVEGVIRAKRRPYIPVVLSKDEVDKIIKQLDPPYDPLDF